MTVLQPPLRKNLFRCYRNPNLRNTIQSSALPINQAFSLFVTVKSVHVAWFGPRGFIECRQNRAKCIGPILPCLREACRKQTRRSPLSWCIPWTNWGLLPADGNTMRHRFGPLVAD
jgi:hypothetical protein